MTKSPYPTS